MSIIGDNLSSALWDEPNIVALCANSGICCASICGTCLGFRFVSSHAGSSDPMLHVCHVKLVKERLEERTPRDMGPLEDVLHYSPCDAPRPDPARVMQIQAP